MTARYSRVINYRLDYAKERSVFVVQAKSLGAFLAEFEVDTGWRNAVR